MTQNNPNAGPPLPSSPPPPPPPAANPQKPVAKPPPPQAAKPVSTSTPPPTPAPAVKPVQPPAQTPTPRPAQAANIAGTPKPTIAPAKPPAPAAAPVTGLRSSPASAPQSTAPIPADPLEATENRAVKWIVGAFVAGTIFCVAVIVMIVLVWSRTANQSAVVPAPPPSTPGARSSRNSVVTPSPSTPSTPIAARTPRRARGSIDYSHIPPTIPRLNYAARHHDIPSVEQFIAAGDDVNGLSREGFNAPPIVHALANSNDDAAYETVKTLLNHNADPNGHSPRHSALIEAILHRSIKCAELLLEKGADPTWKTPKGDTALTYAQNSGNKDMLKLIQEGLANWKPASAASSRPPATQAVTASSQPALATTRP